MSWGLFGPHLSRSHPTPRRGFYHVPHPTLRTPLWKWGVMRPPKLLPSPTAKFCCLGGGFWGASCCTAGERGPHLPSPASQVLSLLSWLSVRVTLELRAPFPPHRPPPQESESPASSFQRSGSPGSPFSPGTSRVGAPRPSSSRTWGLGPQPPPPFNPQSNPQPPLPPGPRNHARPCHRSPFKTLKSGPHRHHLFE